MGFPRDEQLLDAWSIPYRDAADFHLFLLSSLLLSPITVSILVDLLFLFETIFVRVW